MERISALFFALIIIYCPLHSQKPSIDLETGKKWNKVDNDYSISSNGQYLGYIIENQIGSSVAVQAINGKWKMIFAGATNCFITQNSRNAIIQVNDSLAILDLDETHHVKYISGIYSFQHLAKGINDDWLIYRLKKERNQSIVREVSSGRETTFDSVSQFWAFHYDQGIMMEFSRGKGDEVKWWDGIDSPLHEVWHGRRFINAVVADSSSECVFSATDESDSGHVTIWYFVPGKQLAEGIVDHLSEGVEKGWHIEGVRALNAIDGRVFFNLSKEISSGLGEKVPSVDIWSYKDPMLQSEQLYNIHSGSNIVRCMAEINIGDRRVIQLDYENEKILSPLYPDKMMSYILVAKNYGGDIQNEWNWNKDALQSVYLVSLRDGARILIDPNSPFFRTQTYALSYLEHYVYYYNSKSRSFYSYDISTGVRKNMTAGIQTSWNMEFASDRPDSSYYAYPIAGFLKDEDGVVVYDHQNIYELNPAHKNVAVNLTGKLCGSGNMEIRLFRAFPNIVLSRKDVVICHVFDKKTKQAALFRTTYDSLQHTSTFNLEPVSFTGDYRKALDTNLYFVVRMTAESSPNIFVTKDCKTYFPVSDVHPEGDYNWLKTELITWKTFDGSINQGILFKPENFSEGEKYPLIVFYYERLSNELHNYRFPSTSDGDLNIPFFVSHGYLVFVPDIHYKVGWPGRSAYNSVVSGAEYLSKRKYIDARRMGIEGHSFGGFETNYIVTHSHLFAAALSASGMTDFISAYGSVIGDGSSRERQYELYRDRIGFSLWERPDLYIENSPVLRADKITTPLLMLADKEDQDVPYQQSVELFTALRRLGKKAWMLQYDGEGHNVFGKAAEDYSRRTFQFFNYYLKGEPPPKWMTAGVPARLKGIDSGLESDTSGARP